jgi:endoglucanase
MSKWERSRKRLTAVAGVAALLVAGASAPAQADEVEQVRNGGFDG